MTGVMTSNMSAEKIVQCESPVTDRVTRRWRTEGDVASHSTIFTPRQMKFVLYVRDVKYIKISCHNSRGSK